MKSKIEEVTRLEAIDLARQAVEAATNKQATDVALIDTRDICNFADYFVICSGDSDRQIQAIHDEIYQALKKDGEVPHHEEGNAVSGWLLLDYNSVIIHIFAPNAREFYQLDKLWEKGNCLVRIQ